MPKAVATPTGAAPVGSVVLMDAHHAAGMVAAVYMAAADTAVVVLHRRATPMGAGSNRMSTALVLGASALPTVALDRDGDGDA